MMRRHQPKALPAAAVFSALYSLLFSFAFRAEVSTLYKAYALDTMPGEY